MTDHVLSQGTPAAPAQPPRRGMAAKALTIGAAFLFVASACSSGSTPAPSSAGASQPAASQSAASEAPSQAANLGATTLGSNESDAVPKAAVKAMFDYCSQQTGATVTINTTDHNTFQNKISSYLQGTPDDIVKWFAGYRLQFFAAQGLETPIDDVWQTIGANYSDAMAKASTGADGKKYFVPLLNYPWVVMYRPSVFQAKNYTVPKTWDEFVTLAKKMQADGIVPLALGDKDGWPAMGTFDILNMRMNGYQFHIDLMSGKAKWTDPKVAAVFKKWTELLPYTQTGAVGRTWQEAAQSWANGKAGMYFLGTFATQQVPAASAADVDFFTFPTLGTQYDSENAIDAPIDGFMLSKAPKNAAAAKAYLACIGTAKAQATYLGSDHSSVAAVKNADTSNYTDQQKKMADIIGKAGAIAQFLDRDSRPDFATTNGMQQFLQNFLQNPNQDLAAFTQKIQSFWDSLGPAQ